jgi:hypothetical protein
VQIKVIGIYVFARERQRRGIFITLDHPNLASSRGATSRHVYVAPPELAIIIIIKAINIELLRS